MKAFAYVEKYYPEGGTNIRYVLEFPLLSSMRGVQISHIDREKFGQILEEQRGKGVRVITHRLPWTLKSIDEVATEDYPPKMVKVERTFLDRAA